MRKTILFITMFVCLNLLMNISSYSDDLYIEDDNDYSGFSLSIGRTGGFTCAAFSEIICSAGYRVETTVWMSGNSGSMTGYGYANATAEGTIGLPEWQDGYYYEATAYFASYDSNNICYSIDYLALNGNID